MGNTDIMKLELSIHATKLKNVAGAFKGTSDPFAVVTKLSTKQGVKPVVLGKTEVIKNDLNPSWVKVFVIDYELGTPCKVAINIFDEVRKGNNIGMGSAVFDVGELLGARGNTQVKKLKKGGTLFASVRKQQGSGVLRLKLKGDKLKNTEGMFSKSDPFFELSRKVDTPGGQTWDKVYRSDFIKNNLCPVWEEATIELSLLCGGDLNSPLEVVVYDYEKSGKHVLMGRIETSVNALVEVAKNGATKPMTMKKKGKDTGFLHVMKAEVHGVDQTTTPEPPTQQMADTSIAAPPSVSSVPVVQSSPVSSAPKPTAPVAATPAQAFVPGQSASATAPAYAAPPATAPHSVSRSSRDLFVDYVSGGCELNVVVAIDFTGSNGDPRKPGTLHHINPQERNQYEKAIAAIVSILLQYDSDKKVPVLGFGAKYGGVVRHCFQCGPEVEVEGLQGVLDAYKSVFQTGLVMSRPTVFTEVMEQAAQRAHASQAEAQARGLQAYTILLILTDGAVADVKATADCLSRIGDNPLSVVIVGVGNEDFSSMQFLDDVNASGTGARRDIVQFVPFNQHAHSSQSLTKATLEEIPDQLVGYFQSKNIPPAPAILRSQDSMTGISANAPAEEEIDLSLDIGEDEIVVTGGGDDFVDGFNAR